MRALLIFIGIFFGASSVFAQVFLNVQDFGGISDDGAPDDEALQNRKGRMRRESFCRRVAGSLKRRFLSRED